VAQLVAALRYKLEGRGVRYLMMSLEVFIDFMFLAPLWLSL
jgi:hypothetical protein